jgi:hypothetical protein
VAIVSWILPIVFVVLSAMLATGGRTRRAVALALAVAALCAPYLHPDQTKLVRGIVSLAAVGTFIRGSDLVFRRQPTPLWRRLVHVLSVPDSFGVRPAKRVIAWGSLARAAIFAALAALGVWLALGVAPSIASASARQATRWLGGLVCAYSFLDAAVAIVTVGYRAAGWNPGVMHSDPILARSIREFWGLRWNRVVSAWLGARVFRPLARRGHATLGLALSFVTSAALHWYVADPALGARWAAIVATFFLIQGFFAWLEGPLRVARWRPGAAHTWTVTILVGSSPLFCEAFLQVLP